MFNVYEFDRRCSKNDIEQRKKIQEKIVMNKLKSKNSVLDVQYRQRVGNFIKKIIHDNKPDVEDNHSYLQESIIIKNEQSINHGRTNSQMDYEVDVEDLDTEGREQNIQNRSIMTNNDYFIPESSNMMSTEQQQKIKNKNHIRFNSNFVKMKLNRQNNKVSMSPNTMQVTANNTRSDFNLLQNQKSLNQNRTIDQSNSMIQSVKSNNNYNGSINDSSMMRFGNTSMSNLKQGVGSFRDSYQGKKLTQLQMLAGLSQDAALRNNQGLRFKGSTVERVMDAVEQNKICEPQPSTLHEGTTYEKIMNLRPRDRASELNGDFKFKPNNAFQKFYDHVSKPNPGYQKTDDIFAQHLVLKNKSGIALRKNLQYVGQTGGIISKRENFNRNKNKSVNSKKKNVADSLKNDGKSRMTQNDSEILLRNNSNIQDLRRKQQQSQLKIEPRNLFPQLHKKTYFKASHEYSVGPLISSRSQGQGLDFIEKQVLNATYNVNNKAIQQKNSQSVKNNLSKISKSSNIFIQKTNAIQSQNIIDINQHYRKKQQIYDMNSHSNMHYQNASMIKSRAQVPIDKVGLKPNGRQMLISDQDVQWDPYAKEISNSRSNIKKGSFQFQSLPSSKEFMNDLPQEPSTNQGKDLDKLLEAHNEKQMQKQIEKEVAQDLNKRKPSAISEMLMSANNFNKGSIGASGLNFRTKSVNENDKTSERSDQLEKQMRNRMNDQANNNDDATFGQKQHLTIEEKQQARFITNQVLKKSQFVLKKNARVQPLLQGAGHLRMLENREDNMHFYRKKDRLTQSTKSMILNTIK